MQKKYLQSTGQTFHSIAISGASALGIFHRLKSSLGGFRANRIALQENETEPVMSAIFGLNSFGLFAKYNQATQSWKTCQAYAVVMEESFLEPFSGTWPKQGMMQSGLVFRLATLVRHTGEKESGLLPTLSASEYKGASKNRYKTSAHYHGNKTAEAIRSGEADPQYLHPNFAEVMMGFPSEWTECEH